MGSKMTQLILTGEPLTIADVVAVARDGRRVELSLTRAGERVAARIDAHRDEMLASVRAVLTPAEVTAALRTASKLLALSPYAELVARRRTLV